MIVALTFGAMILAAMSIGLPFRGLLPLCLLWGSARRGDDQGRTIVQIAAPETHRARILSDVPARADGRSAGGLLS